MYLKAYAKINLALNVVNKRKDGFHNLDMIVLPLKLHDTIAVSRISKKQTSHILINDEVPNFPNNICENLIKDINDKFRIKKKYEFAIYKEIPMQAGLGGGSSDAATIYRFYDKKFKLNMPGIIALNFLKQYGSDIPFFVINKPARIKGIGDLIEPIQIKKDYYVLIVKPRQGLDTKEVYQALNKTKFKVCDIDSVVKALAIGDDELLAKSIGNSLEAPAIKKCPKIKEIKDYLIGSGFPITLMTGAGSAVFSLSTDKDKVKQMVNNLKKLNYQAFYTTILKE
ncbi:MAG: 4-(cytidine 5'-diphospho)-2-C-methyl-D-erythritol kinase [Bacilli bacterium]|nr:4-(cytidine 5'-diphospho)-2-C-methyl-D-erythritol kinase [Bacilli bacterium]